MSYNNKNETDRFSLNIRELTCMVTKLYHFVYSGVKTKWHNPATINMLLKYLEIEGKINCFV